MGRWLMKPCGLLVLLLVLGGCVHAVSESVRLQAEPNLSFDQLAANPEAYLDRVVIAGGTIVETRNVDQRTLLEVVQRPLDAYEKPLLVDRSSGRFMARCDQYLDPEIYTPGREVTIAGRVLGSQEGSIGQSIYVYPLLSCLEIRLWPQRVSTYHPYDPYPTWYWSFWYWPPGYFWYPPYYYHYHHHHR